MGPVKYFGGWLLPVIGLLWVLDKGKKDVVNSIDKLTAAVESTQTAPVSAEKALWVLADAGTEEEIQEINDVTNALFPYKTKPE